MVTNMPIKLKVKIFKISLDISILRFGVWGFDFILALDIPNVVACSIKPTLQYYSFTVK